MNLQSKLIEIKGVGPELSKKLASLGLHSVHDLLQYYPRRYDDYSTVETIASLQPGTVTICAEIKQVTGRYVRRGMHITEAVASDETGSVKLVWFNQPYRENAIKRGVPYFISGDFALKRSHFSIMNPAMELKSDMPVNTARIVPIYRENKQVKSAQIRKIIRECLPVLRAQPETLPAWIIKDKTLASRTQAITNIHFPDTTNELEIARRRLGFEEVFELTLAALMNKLDLMQDVAVSIPFDESLAKEFVKNLPFTLTDAQRKTIWQVYLDMQKTQPMNRLVEGDVGSGKTVVAVMAAIMAMRQGFQVALMAPTEILARQHAETVSELLEPLGEHDKVALLVGGLKPAQKKRAHEAIASGAAGLIVGTHALIQDAVDMHKLGLVIVDEQHRFGVDQRKRLQAKAGHALHVLNMTATPIPRSLALTLYGELDISVIDVKPSGRKPIITKIISPNSRKQLNDTVLNELNAGRQMFVVCPLISDSDSLNVTSAEGLYEQYTSSTFKNYRVGLLHGKMKSEEKDQIMQQFSDHQIDILVATTVIEVGVNVPNATVMIIEAADRFGLAQMHQLRGRVGRSDHQGYCYLVTSDSSQPSRRLRALEQSNDGFKLAELDLDIRGPGAIYGTMQHGQLDLRIAKLSDTTLIAAARATAQQFIDTNEDLLQYKVLHDRVQKLRAVTNLN